MVDKGLSRALTISKVRYSRVWEDHRTVSQGLEIGPEDVVLCITSSGDNVLNLLLDEPRKMIAIDMSPAQSALLQLKMAAIRHLCYEDFLILLGETDDQAGRWQEIYQTVKEGGSMPPHVVEHWDLHCNSLKSDGSWCGIFEKYILELSTEHLPKVVTSEQIDALFSAKSVEEQRRVFEQMPRDQLKEALCQFVYSQQKGRDQTQLNYVQLSDEEKGKRGWKGFCRLCQDVPAHDNFYFSWCLRGQRGYDPLTKPKLCPPYVTRDGFTKLKGLVDRVEVYTKPIEEYLTNPSAEKATKVSLSNIFEYMSREAADHLYEQLAAHVPKGGRVMFWQLYCPRMPSTDSLKQRLCHLEELSARLFKETRVWWFTACPVLEVK